MLNKSPPVSSCIQVAINSELPGDSTLAEVSASTSIKAGFSTTVLSDQVKYAINIFELL